MHVVAVLAFEGIVGFDLTIPCQVFSFAPGYEVRVCADTDIAATAAGRETFRLSAPYGLAEARRADTVVVPGGDPANPPPEEVLGLLRETVDRGARVASICTGAFVLAAAGLLDGRPAATHWLLADDLARAHPRVRVDPSVLFVDDARS
uniref:DJ-1/PfpI family protein n=1 Tax=Streptomonospora nanhaiensis TaxID=1323731 RepID=UPI0020CB534C|nr:DJ-1/PfpI family protein [Streptomonospora nanhaiensis]